jgi:hypothetical protein
MEMLREYLVVLGYILLVALVLGAIELLVVWLIARAMPNDEGNRRVQAEVLRAREEAREEALAKIAARAARKGY